MGLIKRGMENGMKREMKENKLNNFIDTAAYKGVRFETKQNLDSK